MEYIEQKYRIVVLVNGYRMDTYQSQQISNLLNK